MIHLKIVRGGGESSLVRKLPDYRIDVGLDHKRNLLNKAAKLGLYSNFVEANANDKLPFENESFRSVFSNIIYWLDDPEKVFKEIHRILKKDGQCCVMLPSYIYLESSFYYTYYLNKGKPKEFEFLKLIDRGRIADNLKQVRTCDEWKDMIGRAGLRLKGCVPHLSKTFIQMWDIGLRPIFPMLKRMTMHLDQKTLLDIKRDWVELFQKIGEPMISNERLFAQNQEMCFYCFILQKI